MNYVTKALSQIVATIVAAITPLLLNGGDVHPADWINVAITGVGAFMVFVAPNVPGAMYTKAIISGATAALTILASVLSGGVTSVEIAQILIAFVGTVSVAMAKNGEPDKPGKHSIDSVRAAG